MKFASVIFIPLNLRDNPIHSLDVFFVINFFSFVGKIQMKQRKDLKMRWRSWRKGSVETSDGEVVDFKYFVRQFYPKNVINKHPTKINLSSNSLRALLECIGDFIYLTHLSLNDNHLTLFPSIIKQLKKLQELDLRNNKLTALSKHIADLKRLERLYVEGNPLAFGEIRSLMELMDKKPRLWIDIAGEHLYACWDVIDSTAADGKRQKWPPDHNFSSFAIYCFPFLRDGK